jgi:flagellar basal body-associated protein FliL
MDNKKLILLGVGTVVAAGAIYALIKILGKDNKDTVEDETYKELRASVVKLGTVRLNN